MTSFESCVIFSLILSSNFKVLSSLQLECMFLVEVFYFVSIQRSLQYCHTYDKILIDWILFEYWSLVEYCIVTQSTQCIYAARKSFENVHTSWSHRYCIKDSEILCIRATFISVKFSPWQQLLISQKMKLISIVDNESLRLRDICFVLLCF